MPRLRRRLTRSYRFAMRLKKEWTLSGAMEPSTDIPPAFHENGQGQAVVFLLQGRFGCW